MARFVVGVSLVFASLAVVPNSHAQIPPSSSTTSTPIPGAGHNYLGEPVETVNPVNGSLSFRIKAIMPPGRGITLPFSFAYDSNGVNYMSRQAGGNQAWLTTNSIVSQGGWSNSVPVVNVTELSWTATGGEGHKQGCVAFVNYVYQDANGNRQNLDLTNYSGGGTSGNCYLDSADWPYGFSGLIATTGGEGSILATIPSNGSGTTPGPVSITEADGTGLYFPNNNQDINGAMATQITDRNGNFVTINPPVYPANNYSYVDTAGRTVLQDSGFAISPETVTISGLGAPYTLTWVSLGTPSFSTPITTIQGTCGPGHNPWNGIHGVSAIKLPNTRNFSFAYDSTYGLVNKITYPTGGYIRYVWGMNSQAEWGTDMPPAQSPLCVMLYGVPAVTDRYVSFDGSTEVLHQHFSYSTTWSSGYNQRWLSKQTTVTTTDNVRGTSFNTVYTYSALGADVPPNTAMGPTPEDPVEASIAYYDTNGSLLKTVTKTWVNVRLLKTQETTYPSGEASETAWTYNINEMETERDDYDFGTAAPPSPPGPLLKKTVTSYASFGSTHIVDKPSSVQIYDGGNNFAAETDYGYDETSPTPTSGIVQHTTGCYCGNLTSKTAWVNSSGSSKLKTTYTYDNTGQKLSMTEPSQALTQYSYLDSYTSGTPPGQTNACLTQATYPQTSGISHIENYSYSYADGQRTVFEDQNGNSTNYAYSDSLDRLTETEYPDGGVTKNYYNDSASPPNVQINRLITSNSWLTTQTNFDGLGHIIEHQLTSDPSGTDFVDTKYDGLGRVYSVSEPYRSGGTVYNNTFSYDALGRTTNASSPNGGFTSYTYTNRAFESNKDWNTYRVYQVDGLGRTLDVCELDSAQQQGGTNGISPQGCGLDIAATGFLTKYTYDALGNLLTSDQIANITGNQNHHAYAYDGLSRLVQENLPEQWGAATTYSYNSSGDLYQRVTPLENQSSGYVTTTYSYDALHRVKTVSYNDTTSSALWFYYDSAGPLWPGGPTVQNPNGRMVEAGTTAPNGQSTLHTYGYDKMGRINYHGYFPPSLYWGKNTFFTQNYSYDYLGDPQNGTNFLGNWNNYYNTLGQLKTISASWLSPTQNGDLVSNRTYSAAGKPVSDTLANQINETWGYDQNGNVSSYGTGGVSYAFGQIAWVGSGFVTSAYDNIIGSWAYTYDSFGRLATSTCNSNCPYGSTNVPKYSYDYDPFGNRWHQNRLQGTGNNVLLTMVDPAGHISSADGVAYDVPGNVTSDGSHSYSYDAEGRIVAVDGGGTESFIYDAFGRVSSQTTPSGTVEWEYDTHGNVTSKSIAGTTTLTRADFYEGGRHWAFTADLQNLYFIHTDWLGTERATSNLSLTQGGGAFNLPFGDGVSFSGNGTVEERFTDQEHDPNDNLELFPARSYDSQFAHWHAPDPAGKSVVDIMNPQTWNRYSYVLNNPMSMTDPTGLAGVENKGCAAVSDSANCSPAKEQASDEKTNGQEKSLGDKPSLQKLASTLANAYMKAGASVYQAYQLAFSTAAKSLSENPNFSVGNISARDLNNIGANLVLILASPEIAEEKAALSMDEAVEQGAAHVEGQGIVEDTGRGTNYQFRNTAVDSGGNTVTKIARFDVNPTDPHVISNGPHLNVETQINGRVVSNEHTAIDSATVRPGDYP